MERYDEATLARIGRETLLREHRKTYFDPGFQGGDGDPIEEITLRGARASQAFAALLMQSFDLQHRFLEYTDMVRAGMPEHQQRRLDAIVDQVTIALNTGTLDNAEKALDQIQGLISPYEERQKKHSTWQRIWHWPDEPPATEDKKSFWRRVWEA